MTRLLHLSTCCKFHEYIFVHNVLVRFLLGRAFALLCPNLRFSTSSAPPPFTPPYNHLLTYPPAPLPPPPPILLSQPSHTPPSSPPTLSTIGILPLATSNPHQPQEPHTTTPHKISISNLLTPLNPPQHLAPLAVLAVGWGFCGGLSRWFSLRQVYFWNAEALVF